MAATVENIREQKTVLEKEEQKVLQEIRNIMSTSQDKISKLRDRLNNIQKSIYNKKIYLSHIEEIFRLANIQFPRLHKPNLGHEKPQKLSLEDINELCKWISRAQSEDGLKDIIAALEELGKYSPHQVDNIYALTQKIIIGGAYKKIRK